VREDGGDGEAAWCGLNSRFDTEREREREREREMSDRLGIIECMGLTRALDVHKVGVGRLYEALELVAALLGLGEGVEEVDGESLNFFHIGITREREREQQR
jgi:hypothetical protein